jgi:two-component system sensor histidine kinase QseC
VSSIRKFLIVGILATLTLFNFIAALRGYQSSMREADTLFDNELLDLSTLVANLDIPALPDDFHLGNNLAFQVWRFDELLASTHQAPREPMNALKPGFEFSNFDGYRWRTYTRHVEADERWIIVAERTDQRFLLAENVVIEAVIPILLGIPLVGLLIWVLVSRGLKPLHTLSTALRQKQVNDLSPLPAQGIPTELAQVVQSTNGFINRLSAALEREKRFSADAAHELRTPISALKVQLHNLAQEVPPGSESYAQLEAGVVRMQHLVEQLLSLYRTTPDQFDANCVPVDLEVLAQDVIAQLYAMVEQRGQSLELESEPAVIRGDPFALETLLSNLLTNASKYTQEGGSIHVQVAKRDGEVVLSVADNGPGISDAEKPLVFERFYRRDDPGTQRQPGCGLGLTIVQHVATLHQARVEVGDAPGGGALFTVHFPGDEHA